MRNIFIAALKIGAQKLKNGNGISYNELESTLKNKGFSLLFKEDDSFALTFFFWYLDHFNCYQTDEDTKGNRLDTHKLGNLKWREQEEGKYLRREHYLTAKAYFELMQYQQQKKAYRLSWISVAIAILAVLLTIFWAYNDLSYLFRETN